MAGSCIAVILIAIVFETLKSYKPNQQKPHKENSETTPLIRRPNQDLTRYKICYKMLKFHLFYLIIHICASNSYKGFVSLLVWLG